MGCGKVRLSLSPREELVSLGVYDSSKVVEPFKDRPELLALFLDKIELGRDDGCWVWLGATQKGYGAYADSKTNTVYRSHQLTYRLFVGAPPSGTELDHLCRIPACVNPQHLEPVTHKEMAI